MFPSKSSLLLLALSLCLCTQPANAGLGGLFRRRRKTDSRVGFGGAGGASDGLRDIAGEHGGYTRLNNGKESKALQGGGPCCREGGCDKKGVDKKKSIKAFFENLAESLGASFIDTLPFITKLYSGFASKKITACITDGGTPGECAAGATLWALSTIPFSVAMTPLNNLANARKAAGGSLLKGGKQMWERDGFGGFFRNMWLTLLNDFAQYSIFALISVLLQSQLVKDAHTEEEKAYLNLASAVMAFYAVSLVTNPVSVLQKRLAADPSSAKGAYGCGACETVNTIQSIAKDEGSDALFAGMSKRLEGGTKALTWAYLWPLVEKRLFPKPKKTGEGK